MVRVNRVRRIIRKIDPWTVLKVTLVLNFVVALTVVLGFSIMWVLLVNAGVPQGLEDIARRLALLDQDASLVGNIEPIIYWFGFSSSCIHVDPDRDRYSRSVLLQFSFRFSRRY